MGKKQQKIKKVVLDTSVLVSALLFRGELSKIVMLWQKGKIIPVISKGTFDELRTVLKYPKFSLSSEEIDSMIENEILPYFEIVEADENIKGICRDPEDDKFIACAVSASADVIVTGDKDLSDLKQYKSIRIIKPTVFLRMFIEGAKSEIWG